MLTIAWDVDDVLNDFTRAWFEEFWLPNHPKGVREYDRIVQNPPHKLLCAGEEEYLASLDEFRLSGRFDRLMPLLEVFRWFENNGSKCRHVALTKVPVSVSYKSASWVMKNFGMWIRSFHFVPSFRKWENPPVYDENKGAYLNYFGKAGLLIDDDPANTEAAKKVGIRTLLFPRPWNQSKQTIKELLNDLSCIAAQGSNNG